VRLAEIRLQAQVCFERSARAANEQSQSTWLAMAQLWLDKAQRFEREATDEALAEIFRTMRTENRG
jgi:hypothetical protein